MKAIIEFNLPEDQEEFKDCVEGSDLRAALQGYDNWLRGELKHNDKLSEEAAEAYDKARDMLWQFLQDHNIDLWR